MKRVLILFLILSNSLFAADSAGNGKTFGIAVNPVYGLIKWLSMDICIWNIDRDAEINIPIQFAHNPSFIMKSDMENYTFFNTSLKYRRFFNARQNGFFAEACYDFSYMKHDAKESVKERDPAQKDITAISNGILFGVGYRLITESNFFWGCSISFGRQWGRNIKEETGYPLTGSNMAYSIDIFKFGYAF